MVASFELSFPTNEEEFGEDERISYSKLDDKYIAVHDDGSEFEFDPKQRKWIPAEDDDEHEALLASTNSHYVEQPSKKKRKDAPFHDSEGSKQGKQRPSKKQKNPPAPKQNTAVYVTGLPFDATVDEVHELFSKKGGVIAEEIDSGKPRIKMYTDSEGNFKGDALVVFFKPQSVDMAIMLLDDTHFRINSSGRGSGKMRVQVADSSYKKTNYEEGAPPAAAASNGKEAKPQKSEKDRQKIIWKTQKLDAKLADWDDDDPYAAQQDVHQRKDKVVVMKHMFTLQELDEDPAALLDIKEDIREECEKLGAITNLVLYDLEPEGIVSVKFKSAEAAEQCVQVMNGRSFAGRVVEAYVSSGKQKFRESKKKNDDDGDGDSG